MTDDQSLLRISIALWAIVASLIVVLASLRLGSLFVHFLGVQGCLKKNSCDIVTIPQLSKVETVKASHLLGK